MMPRKTGMASRDAWPRSGFNEAGAMMPRKTVASSKKPNEPQELQ